MRILFVSSEVFPFSKTGGLADVSGALPKSLVDLGSEILVITPWYRTLQATPPPLWIGDVEVPFDGDFESVGVGTLERDGVRYAFVGHPDYQREELYGYPDDVRRFARFTRSAPQIAARLGFKPDIVHVNDWHSAYLPLVLTHGWHLPKGFAGLPSILTIHNVQYQGSSGIEEVLYWLRLPGAFRHSYLNHFGAANALQAGLGFANRVTTVSPSYAQEITLPEYGYGLDGTLRHIAHKLFGILNGLDTEVWNPQKDPYLVSSYCCNHLEGKVVAKKHLCDKLQLDSDRPLLAVVSRLVEQKGIDLFLAASDELILKGWSLALLGSGDKKLEVAAEQLAAKYPGRMTTYLGYDEPLAHQVYAGADALAIPSRFEPCGLNQMIAMRYGTLPIARATGGLKDTITHEQTGFLFDKASSKDFLETASYAKSLYGTPEWDRLVEHAMRQDFSWQVSAAAYHKLYSATIFPLP
ncbi:MAG: glycogen synthase [Trueperaceae bacterium]|nr:MAG: glycogen synthase [Trueperaceae bacterium]